MMMSTPPQPSKNEMHDHLTFTPADADAMSLKLRKGGVGTEGQVDKDNLQIPSADIKKTPSQERIDQEITPG